MAMLLLLIASCAEPNNRRSETAQLVPVRSMQTAHRLKLLWAKEDIYLARVSDNMKFIMPTNATLVYPVVELYPVRNASQVTYVLQAIDIITAETLWKTDIPHLGLLRLHDGKFFNLHHTNKSGLERAPIKDNKELPYCSMGQTSILSAYDAQNGQELWGYEYLGINGGSIYFNNGFVYVGGTKGPGQSQLLAQIDVDSGVILDQQCSGSGGLQSRVAQNSEFGIAGVSYSVTSRESPDYKYICNGRFQYCFVAEGERLLILNGSGDVTLGYIDFNGEPLTDIEMDVVVHDDLLVIHLDDSNQLLGFRLD